MSLYHFIEKNFNWEEGSVKKIENLEDGFLVHLQFHESMSCCPYCHSHELHIKDYRKQKILLGHWDFSPIYALVRKQRFICTSCHKTFYKPIPGIGKYQRRSNTLIQKILYACSKLMSFKTVAEMNGVSTSTVIRYFDRLTLQRPLHLPEILSLDEFKGNAYGQRYQVAVNNPQTHEILDILPKRNTAEIIHYFSQFPREERMKVKFVVMDLSLLFRKVVKILFPCAVIIGDRFHIQRLVLWALERVRKNIQNVFRERRIYFKRNKHILNKKGETLTEEEMVCLHEILKQSTQLKRAYALKEAFFKIFSMKDPKSIQEFLSRWLQLVEESGVDEFNSVLKTFKTWNTEIQAGLTNLYSNGFTEGMNNKIKVLKRTAFGYRNFKRFRARILWLSRVKQQ